MKNIIALLLAGLMLLTFVACSGETNNGENSSTTGSVTTADPNVEKEPSELEISANASVKYIAETLMGKYEEYTNLRGIYDEYMAELEPADRIPYEEFLSYQTHVAPVEDMEYGLMGIPTVPAGIGEIYVYQPAMGTIPFIGYVIRVTEGTDVENFKKELVANSDPRWNFCTEANTTVCESFGDIVYFMMMSVVDENNPDAFSIEQKDGFTAAFLEAVKVPATAEK
ncbi:MAG: hypothetical protein IJX28_07440 [Clostridia bacterium]|nr:hypothetical protein [Clostridia bacterium]